ncbi:hypothetical protein CEXT_50091 [Caerostris extrusa]|uniref:Uncharacterized protein n=1 Tax=Caerostris extrusa TaxID=172846 RepID=A0AAV4RPK5_CAEEX|nr:hypothetical protein CEXT_50091 [Caerostris extrusa]
MVTPFSRRKSPQGLQSPFFFGTMWSGLAQQLLDGRLTPEVTRNSNSCFAAFSLSAGNHQGLEKTGGPFV